MSHDVYICYDEKDREVCDAVFDVFAENNIKAWVKSKHFSSGDPVDKITNAIENSKCFVLILSENSKDTNSVITETDIAFSRNIPILAFHIDELKIDGNLEFILETQTKIASFPDSKKQLKALVKETSNIIGKPIDKVKANSGSVKVLEKINPKRKENNIKKYIKIAIPIAIVLALIYLFVIVPTGQHTTDDGVFSMNVTGIDVDGLKYTVHGESYNLPSNSSRYVMNLKFFDEDENMVYEVNSTADEFKSGIIWAGDLHDDNVTHVGFKLIDLNNNVLSQEDYVID